MPGCAERPQRVDGALQRPLGAEASGFLERFARAVRTTVSSVMPSSVVQKRAIPVDPYCRAFIHSSWWTRHARSRRSAAACSPSPHASAIASTRLAIACSKPLSVISVPQQSNVTAVSDPVAISRTPSTRRSRGSRRCR